LKTSAFFSLYQQYKHTKIAHPIEMFETSIKKCTRFNYQLIDSWFTSELIQLIASYDIKYHLLGMVKIGKTNHE